MGLFIVACLALASCAKKVTPQQAQQSRLDWNLKTLVTAYQRTGNTDAAWDEPATNALAEFARSRSGLLDANEPSWEIISTNVAAAVHAGCDDPLVNYLFIKYVMSPTNSSKAFADAFRKVADNMQESSYPPIRKFYASLRALEQFFSVYQNTDRQTASQLGNDVEENLFQVLDDKTTPPEEVYEACHQALHELSGSKGAYENCYNQIEKQLLKNWPDESASWLLKGEAYIDKAWFARGSGYADKVTDEGWKLFNEDLDIADKSLNRAWKLNPKDPRIAVKMMWVELGQGQGRNRMELWFERAMTLDPNNYDACSIKCLYLEPKWYGSIDEMLSFCRECVQNKQWGGRVPLILVDAHWDIPLYYLEGSQKTNYWTRPEVWPDIKAAYDRFLELNPDATGYYHNYAMYAYRCQQWDALNELIPKLGPVNYDFFGGKDEFNKMIQLAQEHVKTFGATPQ